MLRIGGMEGEMVNEVVLQGNKSAKTLAQAYFRRRQARQGGLGRVSHASVQSASARLLVKSP